MVLVKQLPTVLSLNYVLSLFCLLATLTPSFTQDYLVLEKTGTKKRYEYYPGDPFTFRIKGETFRTDKIVALTDSMLIFKGGTVAFKHIVRVSLKEHKLWMAGVGSVLITAGAAYFLIDQFNNSVIQGNRISTDDQVVKVSLILVSSGMALLQLSKKRVNTAKNWRLRLVNIY